MQPGLVKVGVVYDGNYFSHVSNYYNYEHPRRTRLSISGVHHYILKHLSRQEDIPLNYYKIIDARYFRGRLDAHEVLNTNRLFAERLFDDILMYEGVLTHYLPLKYFDGKKEEKGVDVALALEAYEMSILKKLDVLVLIACDSDYVPLVNKLNVLGVRVMILAWEFNYIDSRTEQPRQTVTSNDLLNACTYPLMMHEVIDNHPEYDNGLIDQLFVSKSPTPDITEPVAEPANPESGIIKERSTIFSLKDGYGFISKPPSNVYFHWTNLLDDDFNDLEVNDAVEYTLSKNDRGQDIAIDVKRISKEAADEEE